MRRIKKILKWTGLILLTIVLGVSAITAARQNIKYKAPYPAIKASKDSAAITRGKHLMTSVAHCTDCHSKPNADSLLNLGQDPVLHGGVAFTLPVGTIYSANITSDSTYGIGKFTDAEIARALRYGVHPDGTAVYDFMPFHNVSDADLTDILSYLRTQKPVAYKKPANQLNLVGNLVKAFLIKPVGPTETIAATVKPDTTAAYGKYLVLNVGNCSGCHTKRSMSGEFTGELLAGGNPMGNGLIPPNLTPDSTGRIFEWSQQIFVNRFRMGKLNAKSEMPWESFKRMNDSELKAIYNYLHTVKPVKTIVSK
jgi:mono/diheme cytochrome c family protein